MRDREFILLVVFILTSFFFPDAGQDGASFETQPVEAGVIENPLHEVSLLLQHLRHFLRSTNKDRCFLKRQKISQTMAKLF